MQAQVGAADTQIVALGFAISRSSSVPLRTKIKCGRASASLNICVPHFGQNRRCITLPLSAITE
jgi:hypothetical protein